MRFFAFLHDDFCVQPTDPAHMATILADLRHSFRGAGLNLNLLPDKTKILAGACAADGSTPPMPGIDAPAADPDLDFTGVTVIRGAVKLCSVPVYNDNHPEHADAIRRILDKRLAKQRARIAAVEELDVDQNFRKIQRRSGVFEKIVC